MTSGVETTKHKMSGRCKMDGRNSYLAIEVQKIECKETDADLDVFDLDVLAFPSAEFLEWHELACGLVNSYGF